MSTNSIARSQHKENLINQSGKQILYLSYSLEHVQP